MADIAPAPTAPAAAAPATKPAAAQQPAPAPSTQSVAKPEAVEPDNEFDAFDAKLRAAKNPDVTKPDAKPDEKPKPTEPVKPDDKIVGTPKALREQFEKTKAELQQANAEREALRARIQEAETKGKDTAALAEQMTTLQREREELQGQLRALKQETSPEFKDKYDKPFNQAADFAKRTIEQLEVNNEDGSTRPAKWEDFAEIYSLPYSKAIAKAEELFGRGSSVAIQHMTKLQELDYQRSQALESEKKQWAERAKTEEAERIKQNEFRASTWVKVNKGLEEKNPDWYADDPEDKAGNEILSQGRKLVDTMFSENFHKLSPAQQIALHAQVRQKAAGFGRMVHRNEQLKSRIAQLESENKELRESGPGQMRRGGEQPAGEGDWKAELRKELTA